jgi:hypothetical protein
MTLSIGELLNAHYTRPYPPHAHIPTGNADLEMLDADVVGLASVYLEQGSLSEHSLPIMRACLLEAQRVLPLLVGETRTYFEGVRDLAAAVLAAIDRAPAV